MIFRAARIVVGIGLLGAVLAGCSLVPKEPRYPPDKTRPYEINGVTYRPIKDAEGYVNVGVASWYGPNFDGKPTAIGERFDMHQVSAAHKTLPLPVWVRVTNLENGRQLIVRVNDRGPFVKDREIDLSYAAAKLLGYAVKGTAKVRVEALPKDADIEALKREAQSHVGAARQVRRPTAQASLAPRPATAATRPQTQVIVRRPATAKERAMAAQQAQPLKRAQSAQRVARVAPTPQPASADLANASGAFVQVGAFLARSNAERLARKLVDVGRAHVLARDQNGKRLYVVRMGPFATVAKADDMVQTLVKKGFPEGRVLFNE
ncbi:septal ring lytic transglycosylase RlpA family protein [Magnetofaba australis]|uniref:Endolytic peptidoglycan transglycosylase RlpA n=1 Tax=Magnetofaba australis IT-1 TaxID=1434232 RepID=A0A1Y2K5P0_9PROT|nr:septal ring lytic transglycosylase RlpA family protein [Magnetofaba australis]OSM04850.1 putative lipoprotein A [Magnetofaba australis IT-1]